MMPNVPEMLEAHYGVPMTDLNSINTRLEEKSITFILKTVIQKYLSFMRIT